MATGSDGRPAGAVPPARNLRIPPTAADQLSAALNWLDLTSKGRLTSTLINAAMRHQQVAQTDPSILIAAAVQYLIFRADAQPDRMNRFWHIVDQVSARGRSRYSNTEEMNLL